MTVYEEIFEVIKERKKQFENGTAAENSYTCYLFDKGVDKICKKVGEEATETVIAAKNGDNNELMNEINDLLYHVMVLCANQGLEWSDVEKVLDERNEKIGNLKKFHQDEMYYKNSCGHGFSKTGSCLKEWTESRDTTILYDYANQFGVDTTLITVKIAADGLGQVQVEGKTVPQTYSGKFFAGVAMELYAVPTGGGIFYQWEDGSTDNPRLVAPTDGASYTASFK